MEMQVGRGFSSRKATRGNGEFLSVVRCFGRNFEFVWLVVSERD
jgi:hypothetical protein